MIPDIAFMIVGYGCTRLAIAALAPYRHGDGTMAQVAHALTWVFAGGGAIALLVLGVAVAQSSSSLSNLGG